jgi:hypothetical protein
LNRKVRRGGRAGAGGAPHLARPRRAAAIGLPSRAVDLVRHLDSDLPVPLPLALPSVSWLDCKSLTSLVFQALGPCLYSPPKDRPPAARPRSANALTHPLGRAPDGPAMVVPFTLRCLAAVDSHHMRPGRQLRRAPSSILNQECSADTAYYGAATSGFRGLFVHRGGLGDVRVVGHTPPRAPHRRRNTPRGVELPGGAISPGEAAELQRSGSDRGRSFRIRVNGYRHGQKLYHT